MLNELQVVATYGERMHGDGASEWVSPTVVRCTVTCSKVDVAAVEEALHRIRYQLLKMLAS